jgi:hypothetical protein
MVWPVADEGMPAEAVPREIRVAAAIVVCQATGLVVVAVVLVAKTVVGSPRSIGAALFAALFALLGAAVLALCGRGLLRGLHSSFAPVVCLEVPAVAVGFSLGIQAGRPGYGLPILLSALAVLALLFSPAGRRSV